MRSRILRFVAVLLLPLPMWAATVTVTDEDGCVGTADHRLDVHARPMPVISGPDTICEGETIALDAGTGYSSYLWEPTGATTQVIGLMAVTTTAFFLGR